MERHTTIKIKRLNKYPNIERRSWEAWTIKENQIFFSCLIKYKRNWKDISNVIKTKKPEQVRTYYYRLLRKISKILKSVNFVMDNRDKGNAVIIMLGYWRAKCETVYEECKKEFAEYVKNCVIEQLNMIEYTKSSLYPSQEVITAQIQNTVSVNHSFGDIPVYENKTMKEEDAINDNNSDNGSDTISDEETILKSDSSAESLNLFNFVPGDYNYINYDINNMCKTYLDTDMSYKPTIGEDFVDKYYYNDNNYLFGQNF